MTKFEYEQLEVLKEFANDTFCTETIFPSRDLYKEPFNTQHQVRVLMDGNKQSASDRDQRHGTMGQILHRSRFNGIENPMPYGDNEVPLPELLRDLPLAERFFGKTEVKTNSVFHSYDSTLCACYDVDAYVDFVKGKIKDRIAYSYFNKKHRRTFAKAKNSALFGIGYGLNQNGSITYFPLVWVPLDEKGKMVKEYMIKFREGKNKN